MWEIQEHEFKADGEAVVGSSVSTALAAYVHHGLESARMHTSTPACTHTQEFVHTQTSAHAR